MSINDARKKLKDLEANEVNKRVSKARQKEDLRFIKNYQFLAQRHAEEASNLVKESSVQKVNPDEGPKQKSVEEIIEDYTVNNAEDNKLDKKD
jgi:hypothetical protein